MIGEVTASKARLGIPPVRVCGAVRNTCHHRFVGCSHVDVDVQLLVRRLNFGSGSTGMLYLKLSYFPGFADTSDALAC